MGNFRGVCPFIGRKQFRRSAVCRRAEAVLIGSFPKLADTDADVKAISAYLMDQKKTRGAVLSGCAPEKCGSQTCGPYADANRQILKRRKRQVAVKEKIRVRLKSYDHTLIDAAAEKIVEVAKRNGATVSGPIPLPTEKEIVTILRAVHKYKDSREQFEMRTHKRLIDIVKPSQKVVDALMSVELPAGVEIEVKI